MNIYVLRNKAVKTKNRLRGKISNTKKNLNYLQDLESWGSLEIVKANDAYIEYSLI